MKKPKITEGKWEVNKKGVVYHWGNGPETENYRPCIAKVSLWKGTGDGEPTEETISNAKAISAVPEMIDGLIKCYDFIQELKDHGINNWSEEENIKQALEKAGVEL